MRLRISYYNDPQSNLQTTLEDWPNEQTARDAYSMTGCEVVQMTVVSMGQDTIELEMQK